MSIPDRIRENHYLSYSAALMDQSTPRPPMNDKLLPSITGRYHGNCHILLINPNSTRSMTEACLESLRPTLPLGCAVTGFTAPHPAPSAIEGHVDAILSSEACIRTIKPIADNYDAFLVACYSKHPLVDALREELNAPVIGIMEASLYTARMLGGRFGIVATSHRSKFMQEEAVRAYGLEPYYVGSEATALGVLELESRPREIVLNRVGDAAYRLMERGADCIALGCAGMTDMVEKCEELVASGKGKGKINVIDGVIAGMHLLIAMVRPGYATSKSGLFKSAEEGRKARGQGWL